ncbi:unnamed protein product, partial [Ectocarpus sp. 4 AP-2014]
SGGSRLLRLLHLAFPDRAGVPRPPNLRGGVQPQVDGPAPVKPSCGIATATVAGATSSGACLLVVVLLVAAAAVVIVDGGGGIVSRNHRDGARVNANSGNLAIAIAIAIAPAAVFRHAAGVPGPSRNGAVLLRHPAVIVIVVVVAVIVVKLGIEPAPVPRCPGGNPRGPRGRP